MRGATGAIDHAHWEKDHLEYHVIGDGEAVGILEKTTVDHYLHTRIIELNRKLDELDN